MKVLLLVGVAPFQILLITAHRLIPIYAQIKLRLTQWYTTSVQIQNAIQLLMEMTMMIYQTANCYM